jgi:hypothetical protein
MAVGTTVSGGGTVTLTGFSIYNSGGEEGLNLLYSASASGTNALADVSWTYNVADNVPGNYIVDAYAALAATVTPPGTASVGETLSNGVSISLNWPTPASCTAGPGSFSSPSGCASGLPFTPESSLGVIKDNYNQSNSGGSADTSVLTNAFSEGVPGPTAGAGLPGLILAGGFLFAWRRSRRTNASALPAA